MIPGNLANIYRVLLNGGKVVEVKVEDDRYKIIMTMPKCMVPGISVEVYWTEHAYKQPYEYLRR